MEAAEFDASLKRLRQCIRETIELLRRHSETRWIGWLEKVDAELAEDDGHGILRLQSMYGGMGSFSDLIICRLNKHAIAENEEDRVNCRLVELRGEIYELSFELKRLADL